MRPAASLRTCVIRITYRVILRCRCYIWTKRRQPMKVILLTAGLVVISLASAHSLPSFRGDGEWARESYAQDEQQQKEIDESEWLREEAADSQEEWPEERFLGREMGDPRLGEQFAFDQQNDPPFDHADFGDKEAAMDNIMRENAENELKDDNEYGFMEYTEDTDESDFDEEEKAGVNQDTTENDQEEQDMDTNEQDLSPEDLVIQFFNSHGDSDANQQEVDWNDRDFLKEEYEKGDIQDVWGNEDKSWDEVMLQGRGGPVVDQELDNPSDENEDNFVFKDTYNTNLQQEEGPMTDVREPATFSESERLPERPVMRQGHQSREQLDLDGEETADNQGVWQQDDRFMDDNQGAWQQEEGFKDNGVSDQGVWQQEEGFKDNGVSDQGMWQQEEGFKDDGVSDQGVWQQEEGFKDDGVGDQRVWQQDDEFRDGGVGDQGVWQQEDGFKDDGVSDQGVWQQDNEFRDGGVGDQEVWLQDDEDGARVWQQGDGFRDNEQGMWKQENRQVNVVNNQRAWNSLNNGMESLQIQDNAGEMKRINRDVDEASVRMRNKQAELVKLEKRQTQEANLTECKKKMCSPCEVKQRCVSRNEKGECTSEEPEVKQCCKIDYEPRCKALKEQAEEKTGEVIAEVTAELEAIKKQLESLSNRLVELDKAALHPSESD